MERPCLAPGALVLRTDIRRIQIGQPPLIVMTDSPGLLAALQSLDGSRTMPAAKRQISSLAPGVNPTQLLKSLAAHGAICDARNWDLPDSRLRSAAVALGEQADARLAARLQWTVSITSDGPSHELAKHLAAVLRSSGVLVTKPDVPGPHWRILVCDGEPPRSALALLHDQGQRFSVLSVLPQSARWGPAVDPNFTPCWKCFDAHMTERNKYWQVLCTQFGTSAAQPAIDTLTAGQKCQLVGQVVDDICLLLDTGSSLATGAVLHFFCDQTREEFGFHQTCDCSLLGLSQRHLS